MMRLTCISDAPSWRLHMLPGSYARGRTAVRAANTKCRTDKNHTDLQPPEVGFDQADFGERRRRNTP